MSGKTAKWGSGAQGHNIAVRLGNLAARTQALVVTRRIQGIRNLIQAHSKNMTGPQQRELLEHLAELEATLTETAKGEHRG